MENYIDAERAIDSLKTGELDRELAYDLIITIQRALAVGFRIESITELIDDPRTSSHGVFILEELNFHRPAIRERAYLLLETALKLSRSPDGWRRKVFIEFCVNSKFENDEIIDQISIHLNDTDLWVRCWAMDWALKTSNTTVMGMASRLFGATIETHKDLKNRLSSVDPMERKFRAFKIAVMTKSGVPVKKALDNVGFEDSFTYEVLLHNERNHPKRWEKMPPWE